MTERVMAAIDGSRFSEGVCDAAAWAGLALGAPLTFLHVNDNHAPHEERNLSGNRLAGGREHLLAELARLDEQRAKVPLNHEPARRPWRVPVLFVMLSGKRRRHDRRRS
jgi:nucleotide-binding universal stress UspA family protein